ncbi:MAG: response regulator [Bermanella sp.]
MTKKHIMVVDDTPANLLLVLRVLEEDYRVTCVESGKECLDLLSEHAVDLVLMDVLMPKMNGYECCRHIKQDYYYHLTPVIFLTGQTQLQDKLKGYEAGGADYLTKPCDIQELLSKVEYNLKVVAKSRGRIFDYNSFAKMGSQANDPLQQFEQASAHCPDAEALAELLLNTLSHFNFDACFQFHTDKHTLNFSLTDLCTPLEETLMKEVMGYPKVMAFTRLTLCASNGVSILIKNMPSDDPALCKRLQDILTTLLSHASQRLANIPATHKHHSSLTQNGTLSPSTRI